MPNLNDLPGAKRFVYQANLAAGNYPARTAQMLYLGLQPQRPYKGEDKPPAPELMVTYELVDEFMKDENGNDIVDKPRWISETFPLRRLDNDKARSTERYEVFDPDHSKFEGDILKAINMPCVVTIVNNKNGDKVFDNVANVTAMRPRDAMNCPELKNPTKVFDVDNPNIEIFNTIPKWIQEKITSNLNFKGSKLEQLLSEKVEDVTDKEDVKKVEDVENNNPY